MKIRQMNVSDIDFAFNCTNAEGWLSETKEIFNGFLDYDPKGCFIAEHDSKRVGMCIATKYRNNGFIGELIVIKEMRGRGFGRELFKKSIQYLQSQGISNIFLDGDLDAVPIYEKNGFRKVCRSLRFLGTIKGASDRCVRKATAEDIKVISEIDMELFGDDRSYFLKRRLSMFPNMCLVAEIGGQIQGYIMSSPGIDVVTVGPWAVLDTAKNPEALLESLAFELGGKTLRIGVLESNSNAVGTIKAFGALKPQVPCWRMAVGPSEELGMSDKLYAIGSAAKG